MISAEIRVTLSDGRVAVTPIPVNGARARNERERQVDLRVCVMNIIGRILAEYPDCQTIDVHIVNRPPRLQVIEGGAA